MKIAKVEAIPVSYPEPNDFNALRHLCLARITADDGQVGLYRGKRHTVPNQAGAQPVRIVGQDVRAGIGLKEGSMMSRPPPLLAI